MPCTLYDSADVIRTNGSKVRGQDFSLEEQCSNVSSVRAGPRPRCSLWYPQCPPQGEDTLLTECVVSETDKGGMGSL